MTEDDFRDALRHEPDNLALRLLHADWLREHGDPRGAFLDTVCDHPDDVELRLVFADCLEDHGDPGGELLRLTHQLTHPHEVSDRTVLEERMRKLIRAGVRAPGPFVRLGPDMIFTLIPPGSFIMGSPQDEQGRDNDETQHRVTLTHGFWMSVHQVTQRQWKTLMPENPSDFPGEDQPVEQLSWHDCKTFVDTLSRRQGRTFRLATEAEWEYACRAGTSTTFFFGDSITTDLANYDGNRSYGRGGRGEYRNRTTPVGSFAPNAFGLYDMHGNVWEWVADWYGVYEKDDVVNPVGPETGSDRLLRGGSWFRYPTEARSASRRRIAPSTRDKGFGFRIVVEMD
jgi:uncharacterized protein (TIGR02996 family)